MTRFEKWAVLSTSILTFATGIVYLWMKYFMEPTDTWAVINHPLQPAVLKAHILVAPLLVFAIGMIAIRHVWRHFRGGIRQGRRSGITTAISIAPMILTGYLIQAITHERLLLAIAISHIAVGVVYGLAVAVHAVVAARQR